MPSPLESMYVPTCRQYTIAFLYQRSLITDQRSEKLGRRTSTRRSLTRASHSSGLPRPRRSVGCMRAGRRFHMATLSSTGWIVHDVGLATSIGGAMFGKLALEPALDEVSDTRERDE